ncbi:hypothetical protein IJM86_07500 [bacterium]|nr:hypothetical protein [bacterium]
MAQDLDMSSFLMGTDMQKRVDEYYQSQLQVKELVKATVETSVILALESV